MVSPSGSVSHHIRTCWRVSVKSSSCGLIADCQFDPSGVVLSTSPLAPPTHWKQTVIVTASADIGPAKGDSGTNDDAHLVEEDDIIGWELVLNRYLNTHKSIASIIES